MKILTENQIKEADFYTIEHEPVDSIELMERAAEVIAQAICVRVGQESDLLFFIGKGNNGGDGLAVARMLSNVGFKCGVFMPYGPEELSEECRFNYERLPKEIEIIQDDNIVITENTIIIDALLGSGVKSEVREREWRMIKQINDLRQYASLVISIDLPSGMKSEFGNNPECIVKADLTLTLEFPKLALLLPEAGECAGEVIVLPIELQQDYIFNADSPYYYVDLELVKSFMSKRLKCGHKNSYGHALLVCGSHGMYGAAILSTSAALRSGCGLVTTHIPEKGASALYASAPSAMISSDPAYHFSILPTDIHKYTSVGVGCGIGQGAETAKVLELLLKSTKAPMVIDADALNIISTNPALKKYIPKNSILTPHPGEFRRLVGDWSDEKEKLEKLTILARETNSIVVLKGCNTAISSQEGVIYFNSTGTSGMAKGGAGDVLTGYITGLVSRGYSPLQAALLGVYIHGLAGEKAADYYGVEGMNSSDLIDFLAEAMNEVQ